MTQSILSPTLKCPLTQHNGYLRDADGQLIIDSDGGMAQPNAHLILTAVNACVAINPNHPQVVAESLTNMTSVLREVVALIAPLGTGTLVTSPLFKRLRNVLATVDQP